jgi:nucleotide-binding universal stress UspA family protein
MEASMATAIVAAPAVLLKNILFATDFSDCSRQAMPYVVDLARKFGSNLFLGHIVTPSHLAIGAPEAAPYLYEAERTTSQEELAELVSSPELKDLKIKPILTSGLLEDELVKAVAQNKIDLVVLGTHGRTGIRRLVLGSVAEAVSRVATCPVLTIGPDLPGTDNVKIRRILVPTDFSETSTSILPYVQELAGSYGASITFLHVIPADATVNVNARLLAEDARRTLKRVFRAECGALKPQFLIEFGEPAEAILRAALENKADLIAMGIKNAFTGIRLRTSVAYRVMASAQCPVLTVR